MGWIAVVLGLTVIVYGFLEPGFGLNQKSLILVAALMVSMGLMTYLTEGVEALLARERFGQSAAVRIFPMAVAIAILSVALARLGDFHPGVVYGFVGTAVLLGPSTMNEDDEAQTVLIPTLILLALSVVTWLLVTPLREAADSSMAAFAEGVAVAIFVGGLEGLFFNMIPISFMDGEKIWRWNRLVWLILAGAVTFLFWQVLLNDERAYFDALQETTPAIALLIGGLCLGLSLGTWGFFKLRGSSG
jgi:hypothetical protein